MKRDNVIELATHRRRTRPHDVSARSASGDAGHSGKAADLLEAVRRTKRIDKDDQPILVRNLGRLMNRLDPENPKRLVKRVLQDKKALQDHWPKWKRYVRLPNETESHPHAASGGTFAKIIERLVDETVQKGFDRTYAMRETVYGALKGTSFWHPLGDAPSDDAAFLVKELKDVLDKLAQEADLAEYFKLVSKYPIYPLDKFSDLRLLGLNADREPNALYKWDWLPEEDELELQNWIPWWAPKCVVGHLYIPFQCRCLHVPERGVAEIKKACGGDVTRYNWTDDPLGLLETYIGPKSVGPHRVYHRLPVWLIALPTPIGLLFCMYASVCYWDDFHMNSYMWRQVNEKQFGPYFDAITPCFVDAIGKCIDEDVKYDCEDGDYDPLYVCSFESGINVIGSRVDEGFMDRRCDEVVTASTIDEIPEWLQTRPVQRLLKLTMDSELAKSFVLSPHRFLGTWVSDCETTFRPAFSDPDTWWTPLQQNTIGAYLLRNFVDVSNVSVFDALKDDALAKHAAAREVLDAELSKFHSTFDERYGR